MCSRFEIDAPWEDFALHFGLAGSPHEFSPGEIRPTNEVMVVEAGNTPRRAQWGIPAPWDGKPLINARSETLEQKQTFRPLLENRCLVPASAYFEWRKEGKNKLKNRISLLEETLFSFAGLLSGDHFTIITCKPSASIAHIHNRMPVILEKSIEDEWCDNARQFSQVSHFLKSIDPTRLTASEETLAQPDLFG